MNAMKPIPSTTIRPAHQIPGSATYRVSTVQQIGPITIRVVNGKSIPSPYAPDATGIVRHVPLPRGWSLQMVEELVGGEWQVKHYVRNRQGHGVCGDVAAKMERANALWA